jgi:hypothetical protein
MITLAHHFDYWHYSAFVEHLLHGRCLDDCSTLRSRLPVKVCNHLKYLKKHSKNLQAGCKHDASPLRASERIAKAMPITSDIRYEIRLPSIGRNLLPRLGQRLTFPAWAEGSAMAQLSGVQSKP